jgi:ribonuclease P protein component
MFSAARRVESRGVKLLYRQNGSPITRVAVVVARGCGGSVKRNREKRITREAYRGLRSEVLPGNDLVFLIARFGSPFVERLSVMGRLIERAGLRRPSD